MIYLDNAATSMRKPTSVQRAVMHALKYGGNAGRGGGSSYAGETLLLCRREAASLFGTSPDSIVFTMNATHALNIAINSLAKGKKRAVVSGYEHNAVTRPLAAIEGLETIVCDTALFEPEVFLHKLERLLETGADLCVLTHVSNVFGYILPIERADALCAQYGVPLIIDASQSAGVLSINAEKLLAARFIAMPGHKSLYGPQGTGILICLGEAEPILRGGTGSGSEEPDMPSYLPERLEAGTQNLHGIAGLAEGIRFVASRGTDEILQHERRIAMYAADRLSGNPRIRMHTAERFFCQTGVLSIQHTEISPQTAEAALAKRGIAVRAGLHCAPLAHKTAGTHGTVRISASVFTKKSDIDAACDALLSITGR